MKSVFVVACFILFASPFAKARDVLMVGDSLSCGPFGQNLIKQLAQAGNNVTQYCAVSTSARNWIAGTNQPREIRDKHGRLIRRTIWPCEKTVVSASGTTTKTNCDGSDKVPTFDSLLAKHRNHDVMIALGTNSLPGKADAYYDQMLKEITKDRTKKCIFVGPPHIARPDLEAGVGRFYESISSMTRSNRCQLFDSRPSTQRGTPGYESASDRLHKTSSAGRYWASQMSPGIANHLKSGLKSGVPLSASQSQEVPAQYRLKRATGLNGIFQREKVSTSAL